MEITGTRQREAWLNKVQPPVENVGEGLWSIPVVFPGNPMRYTLSYLLFSGPDYLVIDPGFDSPQGRLDLQAGLRAAGVGLTDVTGIVATHFHTDHLGMASWLRRRSGAWLALGQAEQRHISVFDDPAVESEADRARMRSWGVPEGRLDEAAMNVDKLMHLKQLADPDLRLGDGDAVPIHGRPLTVVETPGHTPGHICLRDAGREVFLSGDHVLPRISPNVSLEIRGDADPLRSCMESLGRLEAETHFEVLPAHEYRFRGLRDRVLALKSMNLERSEEVMRELEAQGNPTVWSVASRLTWSRGFDSLGNLQLRLALSETAAHLQYLRTSGVNHTVEGLPTAEPALIGTAHRGVGSNCAGLNC
ncbi:MULTISPECIES: MBL fold metallo-hydrolase [Paenarthrobacter]|uniref:MBL fold metallo-hydrolase n=1 Tax=Paenarthrobacter TaxID=1742992 RepID=UPI00074D4237|nr:MBL fold metallo-hydrolase [Paenarthrobacter ureafaciens]AMB39048.1 hydroxyacylglutathione hydrolase [Arthrobacter sp. ATCC 21022]UOD81619.1 MBL fold metallo-hydrolase [Paenarthrobacter ureafaciens]WNZ04274.1 MBL fold metallo-hydrolase [Paenarthrobacter ureafaciens]